MEGTHQACNMRRHTGSLRHGTGGIFQDAVALLVSVIALLAGQPAHAQASLHDWQNEVEDRALSRGEAPSYAAIEAWCDAREHSRIASALRAEGLKRTHDLIDAIGSLWCGDLQPAKWIQRIAFPFLLEEASEPSSWVDSQLEARGKLAILAKPTRLFANVSLDGTLLEISTSREGGGDEVALRLIGKRWRFIKVYYGGAC